MKCPLCAREMQKGGIIAEKAIVVAWHPGEEFEKTGLKSLFYRYGKLIGIHRPFRGIVTIPDAWYCDTCRKVTGIFDVTGGLEE